MSGMYLSFCNFFNSFIERPIQNKIKNIIKNKITNDKKEHVVTDEYINILLEKINNKDKTIAILFNIDDGHFITDIFKEAETIIVYSWDKNAIFYNLDKQNFPKAKNIFMFSHPCEHSVPLRFENWYLSCNSTIKDYFQNRNTFILTTEQVNKIQNISILKNHHTYTTYLIPKTDKNLIIKKY
jgi:hypothetical protein